MPGHPAEQAEIMLHRALPDGDDGENGQRALALQAHMPDDPWRVLGGEASRTRAS